MEKRCHIVPVYRESRGNREGDGIWAAGAGRDRAGTLPAEGYLHTASTIDEEVLGKPPLTNVSSPCMDLNFDCRPWDAFGKNCLAYLYVIPNNICLEGRLR